MSILDRIFRPTVAESQTPPTAENNKEVPASEEVSPLESIKDLWQTTDDANLDEGTEVEEIFNIDPAKIQETVSQINFAQVLDRGTLAKISEGGEDAIQAFADALNKVSQHTFTQAIVASSTLTKKALSQAQERFDKRVESFQRQSEVSKAVRSENPIFSHPSVEPLVEAVEAQLARKFPTASPQEISEKAKSYFLEFAKEIQAPEARKLAESSANGKKDTDWEAFFSS